MLTGNWSFRSFSLTTAQSVLIELGILFLPGISALIWLWPRVSGTGWNTPVSQNDYDRLVNFVSNGMSAEVDIRTRTNEHGNLKYLAVMARLQGVRAGDLIQQVMVQFTAMVLQP